MSHHILVVDDDESIRNLVAEILDLEGWQVITATNGREALDRIGESPPRVVLLDMRMPVLNGWDVARELHTRGMDLPVVVMTAAQDARQWAREVNAAAYLAKPFDLEDLVTTVTRFVAPSPPPAL